MHARMRPSGLISPSCNHASLGVGRRARTLRRALLLTSDTGLVKVQKAPGRALSSRPGVAAQTPRAHSYRRGEMSGYRPASGCRPCTSVYEKAPDGALRVDGAL